MTSSKRNERLRENLVSDELLNGHFVARPMMVWTLCLCDIGALSEKCAPADLTSRNELNRAIAFGRVAALGKEDTRRRGTGILGPVGGPRKSVHVGVSAADERQPVSNRLLSECLFSRGLSVERTGAVLSDRTSSAKLLPQFTETTVPSGHTTEHIPVLGRVFSEGTARDGCNPSISPSPRGLPGIG